MPYSILVDIFGFIAAFVSIVSFLPQFLKTQKTQKTTSLSLYSYIIFVSANYIWLIFGVVTLIIYLVNNMSNYHAMKIIWTMVIIVPYSFTTYFSSYILWIKTKNIKKGEPK